MMETQNARNANALDVAPAPANQDEPLFKVQRMMATQNARNADALDVAPAPANQDEPLSKVQRTMATHNARNADALDIGTIVFLGVGPSLFVCCTLAMDSTKVSLDCSLGSESCKIAITTSPFPWVCTSRPSFFPLRCPKGICQIPRKSVRDAHECQGSRWLAATERPEMTPPARSSDFGYDWKSPQLISEVNAAERQVPQPRTAPVNVHHLAGSP